MSSESVILKLFRDDKTVFTTRSVCSVFPQYSKSHILQSLNYYKRRGLLLNPRGGIYAKPGYNKEEMACSLFWPTYISLDYVLAKNGIIYQFGSKITCITYLSRDIEIDGTDYSFHRMKPSAMGCLRGIQIKGSVAIASPERALVDSLYLFPEYTYFDNIESLDRNEAVKIAGEMGNANLMKRVAKIFNSGLAECSLRGTRFLINKNGVVEKILTKREAVSLGQKL